LKALEKDQRQRYDAAGTLTDDVQNYPGWGRGGRTHPERQEFEEG